LAKLSLQAAQSTTERGALTATDFKRIRSFDNNIVTARWFLRRLRFSGPFWGA
jgi:hypothetical protein